MTSNSTGTNSNQSGRNPARFGRIGLRVRKMAEKPRLAKGEIPPMRKKILAIVCILLAVTIIAMLALENGVILLWRQDVAVPDSVTAKNAYAYVLALAERDERATPFYLSLNAGEDARRLTSPCAAMCQFGGRGLVCGGCIRASRQACGAVEVHRHSPELESVGVGYVLGVRRAFQRKHRGIVRKSAVRS